MRSPFHGTLGTLLMLAPLAAVPLLAMFGLPKSRHLDASQSADPLVAELGAPSFDAFPEFDEVGSAAAVAGLPTNGPLDQNPPGSPATSATGGSSAQANPSSPVIQQPATPTGAGPVAESPAQPASTDTTGAAWQPPHPAISGWNIADQPPRETAPGTHVDQAQLIDITQMNEPPAVEPPRSEISALPSDPSAARRKMPSRGSAPPFPDGTSVAAPDELRPPSGQQPFASSQPNSSQNGSTSPNRQLTWQSAALRLQELGIRSYQLEPGASAGEFHFSCFYTPPENPRITHRFEAEATEPLTAVSNVLQQIEAWSARR